MKHIYCLLLIFCVTLFSSCKKIQENKIINGTWEVMKVELNHQDANVMEIFLNGYVSNAECCHYIVDFKENNICTGTYYQNDTIVYSKTGEWKILEFNLVYVNLDLYVNADLNVNRHSKQYYTLDSETNKVAVFGGDEIPTTLEIKRLN